MRQLSAYERPDQLDQKGLYAVSTGNGIQPQKTADTVSCALINKLMGSNPTLRPIMGARNRKAAKKKR